MVESLAKFRISLFGTAILHKEKNHREWWRLQDWCAGGDGISPRNPHEH
jgi:hypothetical protein